MIMISTIYYYYCVLILCFFFLLSSQVGWCWKVQRVHDPDVLNQNTTWWRKMWHEGAFFITKTVRSRSKKKYINIYITTELCWLCVFCGSLKKKKKRLLPDAKKSFWFLKHLVSDVFQIALLDKSKTYK